MVKVTIWRDYEALIPQLQKGAVIEMIFRSIRPASGNYEKLDQITVNPDNIQIIKTAEEALKEAQKVFEEAFQNSGNSSPKKQPVAAKS